MDRLFLGAVLAAAPLFLFPRPRFAWVSIVLGGMLVARGAIWGRFQERTPLDWRIGLLGLMILATCFVVPDIELSLPKVVGTLFGIVLFYSALAVLSSEKAIKMRMIFFLAAGSALAVFGVIGMMWGAEEPFSKLLPRLTTGIPLYNWKLPGAELGINPNALAGSLSFVIPLALVLLFSGKARAARIALLGMVSLVFLAVMFLSQAFGAWIALFISLGLVGMKKKKRLWIAAGCVLILGFFLFNRPARTVVREKFEIRYGLWSTGVTAVQRHPLLGVGMDRLRYDPGIGHELVHAHNQLIHTAAELGIPGLAAYLAILIGVGWMCLDVSKRAKTAWMRDAARGLGAGQLAFLIFGMGDAIPLGGKNGVFFWVSLALIAAVYNYVDRRSEIADKEAQAEACEYGPKRGLKPATRV